MSWMSEDMAALSGAVERLERELPGWWWRIGACSVSADASIGPDRTGPDAVLLGDRRFDEGFHADIKQPALVAEALVSCIDQALLERRVLLAPETLTRAQLVDVAVARADEARAAICCERYGGDRSRMPLVKTDHEIKAAAEFIRRHVGDPDVGVALVMKATFGTAQPELVRQLWGRGAAGGSASEARPNPEGGYVPRAGPVPPGKPPHQGSSIK